MTVLEQLGLDDRRHGAHKPTRTRYLLQFDLGRLVDFGGFTVIIDHLHDDIELTDPERARAGRS